ncbi:unnamed protein product, partial [Ectocarpus sp. 12 AP-2014]
LLEEQPPSPLSWPPPPPPALTPSSPLTHTDLYPVAQASLSTPGRGGLLLALLHPTPPSPQPADDPGGRRRVRPVYTLTTRTLYTGGTNASFPSPTEAGGAKTTESELVLFAAATPAGVAVFLPGMSASHRWVERTTD